MHLFSQILILFFILLMITEGNSSKILYAKDFSNGDTIQVQPAQEFHFVFEGTGGTGATWYVESISDQKMLISEGQAKYHSGGFPGSKGTWTFTLVTSNKTGTVEVKFEYGRHWDDKPWDSKTLKFHIN